jgi:7-keto-8-aminopelargonate synthetase-like enzyme
MRKEFSELINKLFTQSADNGILQLVTQDDRLDGLHVTANGKKYTYFGSCSYLGLEVDERLKKAAIDAVERYGSQFSCSRTFLQMGLYEEIEGLLGQIFGKPTLLAPTTSLGHISCIPVVIGETDAVIADQQVHNSVRNAIQMVRGDGVYIETLPHNRMDMLETRIQILKQNHDRVWYFADGIYSMYGDAAPIGDIWQLMNKYEQFHVYFDDAHGMSWAGKHGRGYVLQNMPFHPRLILTSSLAKGFANCGGALVFDTEEQKRFIKNCGSSFIFSGPLQPAVLGAAIASAKIHLSDEIETLQNDLYENLLFFVEKSQQLNIPVISTQLTPIFYIGTGKPEVGAKMFHHLMDQGIFCNHAMFPAVSVKNSGLRISLTRSHSIADINRLLETVAEAFPKILKEENYSIEEIYKDFNIEPRKRKEITDAETNKKLKVA